MNTGLQQSASEKVSRLSRITRREFFILTVAAAGSFACRLLGAQESGLTPASDADIVSSPTPKVSGILWTQDLLISPDAATGEARQAFFVEGSRVFFSTPEQHPVAVDLGTGEQLWQWDDEGTVYGADADIAYAVRPDNRLYALDSQNGTEKWKVVIPDVLEEEAWIERPLWMGSEGVYLPCRLSGANYATVTGPPVVVAIQWDGRVIWTKEGAEIIAKSDQILLVKDWGGAYVRWRGLEAITGTEKWAFSPGWPTLSGAQLRITDDHVYFVLRSETEDISVLYSVAKMAMDSGNIVWETEQTDLECEILLIGEGAVYVLRRDFWSGDLQHVALNPETGGEFWARDRATYFLGESPPMAFLSSEDLGYTWAVEISSGEELWKNDDLRINRLVGLVKETLIAVYNDPSRIAPPRLFGLEPQTGQIRWRLELSQVSHRVVAFGDRLVYGSGQQLVVVDPETGQSSLSVALSGRPSDLVAQGDVLLVQTGSAGALGSSAGAISAVRI